MKVTRKFEDYNERQCSSPWIAKILSWPVGEKPKLKFGAYLGSHRRGRGGDVEIDAEPGNIIKWGQKHLFKDRRTISRWGVVQADGSLLSIAGSEARELWDERHANTPANPLERFSDDALLTEVKRRGLSIPPKQSEEEYRPPLDFSVKK